MCSFGILRPSFHGVRPVRLTSSTMRFGLSTIACRRLAKNQLVFLMAMQELETAVRKSDWLGERGTCRTLSAHRRSQSALWN